MDKEEAEQIDRAARQEQIFSIVGALAIYWTQNPDLRLGQLVCNFANNIRLDPYDIEDDVLKASFLHPVWTQQDVDRIRAKAAADALEMKGYIE